VKGRGEREGWLGLHDGVVNENFSLEVLALKNQPTLFDVDLMFIKNLRRLRDVVTGL
jgi:hypothetical protein